MSKKPPSSLPGLYGGFTAVVGSVLLISHSAEASLTPPISPALQCHVISAPADARSLAHGLGSSSPDLEIARVAQTCVLAPRHIRQKGTAVARSKRRRSTPQHSTALARRQPFRHVAVSVPDSCSATTSRLRRSVPSKTLRRQRSSSALPFRPPHLIWTEAGAATSPLGQGLGCS